MKLKNLFYLMLAVPMVFAACSKTTEEVKPGPETPEDPGTGNEPEVEYVVDAEMAQAMRVREIEVGDWVSPDNQFLIAFADENANHTFTVFLIGDLEDTTLQAGTYTSEDESVDMVLTSYSYVTDDEGEDYEPIQFAEATVVVAVEGDVYDFVGTFVTAEGDNYRFTYNGEIVDQDPGDEPDAPKTPEFNLTSDEVMEFGQDSTIGTITFEIVNPIDGVNVEAKSNQSWVKNVTVRQANGEIAFEVEANTGAAREAKITATYGMLEFKVTVKQAEYVAPDPELIIDGANEVFQAAGDTGVIEFHVKNAVEGVEATATTVAEWITINSIAEGVVSFTVAANETEAVREGVITLAYGEISQDVKIKQYFEGYNPGMEYSVFSVVEVWASMKNDGKQWDVTFVEHDTNLGDMQTRISFSLAEANTQRVSDGTYSVENGGILINSANFNGYSSYRTNASLAADITAAEFTVATDTDAKVIAINGTFQAGNAVVTLNFNGEMRGMDLGEAVTGAINHTEWASVVKNWHENKELLFTATSADGSLKAVFDFYDYDSAKSLAEGVYPVSAYYDGIGAHLRASSYFTYNNVESQLAEGTATVEHIAGGYKITYNVIDKLGRQFTGVIEGPIEGATNPA